jgi:hypothetical protein
MRASTFVISAFALIAAPTLALADPTGTYNVVGGNSDGSSAYKGTVQVSRTGATYKVVWEIAGKQSIGTGIGTHIENGNNVITGPATANDVGLSVGYLNKDSFGVGTYYRRPDGSWHGVWTSGGSQSVAVETWTAQ